MENKMSYETLIHEMSDEIETETLSFSRSINPAQKLSKCSIIERYFEKVREDTKKDCIKVVEDSGAYDGIRRTIIYRIGKL